MALDVNELKRQAAEEALGYVESGMVVGLGHGSTALYALRGLAERLRDGRVCDILGVTCASVGEREARRLGIPLTSLDERPVIDLTIDGADEVAPNLDLIKGGGGALLREKIVAQASRREIIIIDGSKLSPALGARGVPVPVEVTPFGWRSQVSYLESLGARVALRDGDQGAPFHTDQGNLILDCHFGAIGRPRELAAQLGGRAGIVEHGLFLGLASAVIVADAEGVHHLRPDRGAKGRSDE